ncbi:MULTISPECIES: glycosyltransferase family 2 protein [Aliivibrio]|uniref:Glycosyltransferase family 2 protein n=1 Tax=Aliivibrio finisterrensis TaxID=511998 RepID=A0A4V1Z949_9GAMM|nr:MULTISPECIES: glycosyltransferase [Aliivibrio]MDD9178500.1 glycosyltransferase [Aliivibrio sp. A6]RYU52996.1 glycosyltransferase family 2 protein [Aliivibrio finisterrensis]RYU53392.1 glycosyltransferase family 2 protein [Aliivibrio finisterrensis]RYU58479.1 glycosyltransferase family 2 protein [Aliivibrio finisterrensis]RYU65898.1 glycosyltransferase family 2 protein [Aliivibrio finisterrensis]
MNEFEYVFYSMIGMLQQDIGLIFLFFPIMIFIELPLFLLVTTGVFRWSWNLSDEEPKEYPTISFIITCYGEGEAIAQTIDTLVEQVYPSFIEILVVVDGAKQNEDTYKAALNGAKRHQFCETRRVKVVPKWQRGGRVSTLNAGLSEAKNDLIINVDGDTSFDNNMAWEMAKQFSDPNVLASGGALRVRNWDANFLTRMQSLEYMMSMQAGKTGMSNWGVLNNISGAFGAFRVNVIKQVGGWDTHTAEDLDLTMRLKQYKGRHPDSRLAFSPHSVGHTDAPDTLKILIMQRLRWDGDLLFLFLRKHRSGLTPKLLGWGNFIYTLVYGVIQNVILPLLMVLFTLHILFNYPVTVILAMLLFIYLIYMVFILLTFLIYIGLVSERAKEDIKLLIWLPIYPLYAFFMRLITAFSMVNEITRRSHEESSMAPWWVLKRGKRF